MLLQLIQVRLKVLLLSTLVLVTLLVHLFYESQGPAACIIKAFIPKCGVLKYENGSTQTKFFYYTLLCLAYANQFTDTGGYGTVVCGYIKDYICRIYYKDA